jgi:hypothetical protein
MTTGVYVRGRTPIDRSANRKLAEYKVMLLIVDAIILGLDNNSALSAAAAAYRENSLADGAALFQLDEMSEFAVGSVIFSL